MKASVIQTSFAGGEFAPSLYGRSDIVQWQNACAVVENFLVRPYGPAISAPGSRYVATVSASSLNTRLIPFIFNREDSYVIEMGDYYMRFFTNRGQVTTPGGTETLTDYSANLKAHWKCNDNTNSTTVIDSVGSHSGTLSTLTSTVSTTGIVNQAFNLAGLYYVSVTDNIDFTRTASTQPFTILAWAYYESSGSNQVIFSKWNNNQQREYQLFVNSTGNLRFDIFDETTDGRNFWTGSSALSEGWHFFAIVFSGAGTSSNDCTMYIDGSVESTSFTLDAAFVNMRDTTSIICLGANNSAGAGINRWADKIDNIAFIHQGLTAAQIAALYTASVYQISTVFTENEIFDIHFTQLNDIVWLTHDNHPPQKLIRTSANSWTIGDAPIVGGPFLDNNTPATTSTGVTATTITITPSATSGTVNLTVSPTNSSLFTVSSGTLGHHNSYWMIGGLAQTNATTGLQEIGYVKITHVINGYTATATVIKNLKAAAATTVWAEGAWSAVRGYPGKVAFQERRLWYARTNYEPQKEWASRIFSYDDFALDTEAEDDALNLSLASNESNEIQWIASGGKSLVAGTFGGAFVTNSGSSDPITPDNVNASEQIGFGSSTIQPKKIGSFLYFIQRFGKRLRELFYNWELDTYKAVDRTILSPHILGDGVIDMDAQRNPETVLHCVLSDGAIASLAREVDQEVTAWSRRTTDGTYTSIAIIPSQEYDYDEAWVVVERWVNGAQKKYVEFFENISPPDRQDQCLYLDSALTYDAYEITSSTSATISLSASSGSVTLTSSTAFFVGENVNKRLRAIDADGESLGEGVITATNSTTSITLSITTTFNALSYSAGRWGVSVSSVSGLDHLNAKTVGILADGTTESLTRTVASGSVTLGSNYFVLHVGLSYDQIIYTLPREAGGQKGTAQGKLQRISELAFKVNRSTQELYYGPDASNLDLLSTVLTNTTTYTRSLYTGVIGNIPCRGGYQRGSQVYIKNSNPLPLELLNIISDMETYEK